MTRLKAGGTWRKKNRSSIHLTNPIGGRLRLFIRSRVGRKMDVSPDGPGVLLGVLPFLLLLPLFWVCLVVWVRVLLWFCSFRVCWWFFFGRFTFDVLGSKYPGHGVLVALLLHGSSRVCVFDLPFHCIACAQARPVLYSIWLCANMAIMREVAIKKVFRRTVATQDEQRTAILPLECEVCPHT